MSPQDRPLVWLGGPIKTPLMSSEARVEAGFLLRQLQAGVRLSMPHLRPMPSLGARCFELRIQDARSVWHVVMRIDEDAIVIAEIFRKTTQQTPVAVIERCRQGLRRYDEVTGGR
jgi:phage-related protein